MSTLPPKIYVTVISRNIGQVRKSAGSVLMPYVILNETNKRQVCLNTIIAQAKLREKTVYYNRVSFNNPYPAYEVFNEFRISVH